MNSRQRDNVRGLRSAAALSISDTAAATGRRRRDAAKIFEPSHRTGSLRGHSRSCRRSVPQPGTGRGVDTSGVPAASDAQHRRWVSCGEIRCVRFGGLGGRGLGFAAARRATATGAGSTHHQLRCEAAKVVAGCICGAWQKILCQKCVGRRPTTRRLRVRCCGISQRTPNSMCGAKWPATARPRVRCCGISLRAP